MAMIRRWLTLTYYLYALSHFYFNPLYFHDKGFYEH